MHLNPLAPRTRRTHKADAVVTGAGSGIGRAFATELGARGGRVVCSDISLPRAEQTAIAIRNAGGRAIAVQCDVSRIDEVSQLAAATTEWLGHGPSLVINNAGVGAGGEVVGEASLTDWQWTIGINLWGVIHGCHTFTPGLRERGSGGIINVASAAGFAAGPRMAAYNVSKAGVLALSETLAAELSGSGVAVTVLCPTFVKTAITSDGRITAQAGQLADLAMRWTGRSADSVARTTLDAHDRGELYVLPQLDARMVWRFKRQSPALYTRTLGLLNRYGPFAPPAGVGPIAEPAITHELAALDD